MNKIANTIDRMREFMSEVRAEAHRSAWPTRRELVGSTGVVIVFVIILGVYIGMNDWVLLSLVGWLIG